jgi:Leucine-rich repeat (LRR) protein
MKKYSLFELENTTLRQLNLENNQITETGIIALSKNTTLRELNLGYNQIIDDGVIALSKNTTLRQLNIDSKIILINQRLVKIISRFVKKEFWSFY